MPLKDQSLLDLKFLTSDQVLTIFKRASDLCEKKYTPRSQNLSVALCFFEPSTRTKNSFEMALKALQVHSLNFDPDSSSLTKGESLLDTLLTIQSLGVNALVVRHSSSGILHALKPKINIPIINAGDGRYQHPTQALLDAYTVWKAGKKFDQLRVTIVGDVMNSRVARSNMDLFRLLGAQINLCGPSSLVPNEFSRLGFKVYRRVEDILPNTDVLMLLRMQTERLSGFEITSLNDYHRQYGITASRLSMLPAESLLLHPGPVNFGVELSSDIISDPRIKISEQVQNGVWVRASVLEGILGATQ